MGKAIRNAISPLDEISYSADDLTKVELMLLGTNIELDKNSIPRIEEIHEAMDDYHRTEHAMARFAYQLLPQVVGTTTSKLAPKRTDALDSLIKD